MTNKQIVVAYYNTWKEYKALIAEGFKRGSEEARALRREAEKLRHSILCKILNNVSGIYLALAELQDGNSKPVMNVVNYMDYYDQVKAEGGLNTIYAD